MNAWMNEWIYKWTNEWAEKLTGSAMSLTGQGRIHVTGSLTRDLTIKKTP